MSATQLYLTLDTAEWVNTKAIHLGTTTNMVVKRAVTLAAWMHHMQPETTITTILKHATVEHLYPTADPRVKASKPAQPQLDSITYGFLLYMEAILRDYRSLAAPRTMAGRQKAMGAAASAIINYFASHPTGQMVWQKATGTPAIWHMRRSAMLEALANSALATSVPAPNHASPAAQKARTAKQAARMGIATPEAVAQEIQKLSPVPKPSGPIQIGPLTLNLKND